MLDGLFVASLIGTVCQWFKEASQPVIPASHWTNKDLIRKDRMNNISEKDFARNLANGKYKVTETYPEPHRMEDGRIIIENYKLYREDVKNYGAYQAHEWMRQGKYNLTPEELEKEHKRIDEDFERLYSLLR